MQAIVDDFNANNDWGITVTALDQGQYNDLKTRSNAAIQSGDVARSGHRLHQRHGQLVRGRPIVDLTPTSTTPPLV